MASFPCCSRVFCLLQSLKVAIKGRKVCMKSISIKLQCKYARKYCYNWKYARIHLQLWRHLSKPPRATLHYVFGRGYIRSVFFSMTPCRCMKQINYSTIIANNMAITLHMPRSHDGYQASDVTLWLSEGYVSRRIREYVLDVRAFVCLFWIYQHIDTHLYILQVTYIKQRL